MADHQGVEDVTIAERMADRIRKTLGVGEVYDTKVVAGFPGIGKSECTRRDPSCLDSDSSLFSWKYDDSGKPAVDPSGNRIRDPAFPANYIAHMKDSIGKVPVIFVSSHDIVRDALVEEGIGFNLVYPDRSLRDDYVSRYVERGSPKGFVDMISQNWDKFISELDGQEGCNRIVLERGQYLVDVIGQVAGVSLVGLGAQTADVNAPRP